MEGQPVTDLFLVEDAAIIRERFTALFSAIPDLAMVGQSGSAPEAVRQILRLRPDIAVLDVFLADGSGIDVLKQIRPQLPNAVVIMMTTEPDDAYRNQSLRAGADHFFDKANEYQQIIDAVRAVAERRNNFSN
jgi:two-component system, NarL family, response regulator DevR